MIGSVGPSSKEWIMIICAFGFICSLVGVLIAVQAPKLLALAKPLILAALQ